MKDSMKLFVLSLLLFCNSSFAQWVEGSTVGVRADNSKTPGSVFVNSWTGSGPQAGAWTRIPISQFGMPDDVISVFLTGIIVITHGRTPQICDMQVAIRAPGDMLDAGSYIGQAVEVDIHGGQRSNMSTWAPVRDGHIEIIWNRSTYGQWPDECAYGMNLSAQAYLR